MKKGFFTISHLLISAIVCFGQDTFSIVAVDSATGEVGSAGASCIIIPNQGVRIISDVHPGVGAVHTQAYYLAGNQNYAEDLMDQGYSPQDIIDSLVVNDIQGNPEIRQYGVADLVDGGRSAAYTGINTDDYKGHITGPNYAIQGNILLGQQILDSMQARFLNTEGNLACKLMAALQGAKVPGADYRCIYDGISSLGAFIRVAKPGDTLGILSLDLNVVETDNGLEPIDSLQTMFDASGACNLGGISAIHATTLSVFPNPAENKINIKSPNTFYEVQILNTAGICFLKQKFNSQNEGNILLPEKTTGSFLLKVYFDNGKSEIRKVVLQ